MTQSIRQTPRGPALVCPSCGTYHPLTDAPGRVVCRCGAALETMRLLDRPDFRLRWYIARPAKPPSCRGIPS